MYACIYVYRVCAWYLQRPEDSWMPTALVLQMIVSRHVGAGSNPSPLQEQSVLLTAYPSLQILGF